jgi:hypothetical protein
MPYHHAPPLLSFIPSFHPSTHGRQCPRQQAKNAQCWSVKSGLAALMTGTNSAVRCCRYDNQVMQVSPTSAGQFNPPKRSLEMLWSHQSSPKAPVFFTLLRLPFIFKRGRASSALGGLLISLGEKNATPTGFLLSVAQSPRVCGLWMITHVSQTRTAILPSSVVFSASVFNNTEALLFHFVCSHRFHAHKQHVSAPSHLLRVLFRMGPVAQGDGTQQCWTQSRGATRVSETRQLPVHRLHQRRVHREARPRII